MAGRQYDPDDDPNHDLGPWVDTPQSTRLRRYRFDHATGQIQVEWANNKGPGYVYDVGSYEVYRSFARRASKGQSVNSLLNGYPYRPADPEELSAPSNPNRRGLQSRVR